MFTPTLISLEAPNGSPCASPLKLGTPLLQEYGCYEDILCHSPAHDRVHSVSKILANHHFANDSPLKDEHDLRVKHMAALLLEEIDLVLEKIESCLKHLWLIEIDIGLSAPESFFSRIGASQSDERILKDCTFSAKDNWKRLEKG